MDTALGVRLCGGVPIHQSRHYGCNRYDCKLKYSGLQGVSAAEARDQAYSRLVAPNEFIPANGLTQLDSTCRAMARAFNSGLKN